MTENQKLFKERCARAGGQVLELDDLAEVKNWEVKFGFSRIFAHPSLKTQLESAGIDAVLVDAQTEPPEPQAQTLGIVRAAAAVAETGSVLLFEKFRHETQLSTLSSSLLVLIEASDIWPTLKDLAPRLKEFCSAGWVTFLTGNSCTGDIELVHITGIQGPQQLFVGLQNKAELNV